MVFATAAAAALVALAPGASRVELGGVRVVAAGGASFGVVPGGAGDNPAPWFRGAPIWRGGGALEIDLVRGAVSSAELAVPVVVLTSRRPFGPEELELTGFEVIPELRARIRLYTRLDLVMGVGLGVMYHAWGNRHGDTVSPVGEDTTLGWQVSAAAEWAITPRLGFRMGPAVTGQDNGPMYLTFTGGLSWLL